MHKDISLVVPEVNEKTLKNYKKTNIIANPNCSTTQLVVVLKPLHNKFKIKRVVVSTYQAVSGAGKASMDELFSQTKNFLDGRKVKSKFFNKQIAFNLIPQIDDFAKDGYTKEEWKMENETKKILDSKIKITATCVRVPVRTSHSESINIEFNKSYNLKKVKNLLSKAPGCKVIDSQKNGGYITPYEAEGSYLTYISRIRKDNSNKNAINLWIVSDNLLKGAALNTVQIAEVLIKKYIK
jgi:aspartate-semialdehyde dehydrogenase